MAGAGAVSYEERGTWVYLVTSAGAYAVYLAIILGRLRSVPVAEVPYVPVLLWTTGPRLGPRCRVHRGPRRGRDGQSERQPTGRCAGPGRQTGSANASRWSLVACAVAALVMAMAKVNYFWIANIIYLGFVLWRSPGPTLKLVVYRRGL